MTPKIIAQVRGTPIWWDGVRMWFTAGMTIDGDGANGQSTKPCYGPDDTGLDRTIEAGNRGNWWGIVTERGEPVIQDGMVPDEPAEGFYISTTSYQWIE